jgi:serine/threonine protein kinase
MTSVSDVNPGDRLINGRYRLLNLIGHGSMGTVWRAYDEFLRRPVAVKEVRLPPGMPEAEADELRERTMREARAIGVLTHPNVVTLHDIAQVDGDPYVVMELVPGSSLAHLLREHGKLDTTQAAAVADAVAAALQAAHHAGITHRDVKPANVLVAQDGRIKLADFGIARNVSERTLTSTGITLGSPAYIAPEVASGGAVAPAADLWGLGATLFAAADGRAPYDPDGDVMTTLLQVVNGDVPQPETTGPIGEVITGLMVKDAAARMSLTEVRRLIYPLLPPAGESAFTREAIARAETQAADSPTRVTAAKPAQPEPAPQPSAPPLAPDPGPLPFVPAPVATPRRSVPRALVVILAVVFFLAAAAGGFALARLVGDRPLLPESGQSASEPQQANAPLGALVPVEAESATIKGTKGGQFRVQIPQGWQSFVEERAPKTMPLSTRVHFVSQDGKYQLTVERFADFYPAQSIKTYKSALASTWPKEFYPEADQPLSGDRTGPEPGVQMLYRTVDSSTLRRITFANVRPRGDDLWVVSLTVPIAEEDTGKAELFDRIAPTFTVLP